MVAAETRAFAVATEDRFVLHGVRWSAYVALRDSLDDHNQHVKMTYLRGTLELTSPSRLHEDAKKIIARLIEVWAMERKVRLNGFGGMTFRNEAKEHGLEPDECYQLGRLDEDGVPDIAIEVVITSGLVNKMAIYAGLRVPEVWEWRPGAASIVVHRLVGDAYELRTRSDVLPDLDLALLSQFIRPTEDQTDLMTAFQDALRG